MKIENMPAPHRLLVRNCVTALTWLLLPACSMSWTIAQQPYGNGMRIEGSVTDPTGAVIPGAQVQISDGEKATDDAAGEFVLRGVPAGNVMLHAQADGFTDASVSASAQSGGVVHVTLKMNLAQVQTNVRVEADAPAALDTERGAGTTVLTAEEVQQLPDDRRRAGSGRRTRSAYHWRPFAWYTWYAAWGDPRTVNINAPLVATSTGTPPDPTAALLAPRQGPLI